MKKMMALFLTLILFVLGSKKVSAACDATETSKLNNLAVNVKASYEEAEGIFAPGTYSPPDGISDEEAENYVAKYNYFKVNITNLTEELYVTVYNDVTNETKTYTYSDSSNGIVTIEWKNLLSVTNLTITVYSSSKTNCEGTKLYTLYLTLPKYNEYSAYEICKGYEEFYLCHKYLSVDSVGFDRFVTLLEQYQAGKVNNQGEEIKEEEKKKDANFFEKNKIAIIATTALVVIGGAIVIIVKKQRSKKI